MHDANARLTAWVLGTVQGVGFRWWVYSQAKELALAGSASNLVDGRVCVVAEGPKHLCENYCVGFPRMIIRGAQAELIRLWSAGLHPRGK